MDIKKIRKSNFLLQNNQFFILEVQTSFREGMSRYYSTSNINMLVPVRNTAYTNQVPTIILMTTLLPDWVTFIFCSREIVTTSGKLELFSFPQESFHFHIFLLIC